MLFIWLPSNLDLRKKISSKRKPRDRKWFEMRNVIYALKIQPIREETIVGAERDSSQYGVTALSSVLFVKETDTLRERKYFSCLLKNHLMR